MWQENDKKYISMLLNVENLARLEEAGHALEAAKGILGRVKPMPLPRSRGASGLGQIQRIVHIVNEAMAEVIAIQERLEGEND
jgi:hypothetical protein